VEFPLTRTFRASSSFRWNLFQITVFVNNFSQAPRTTDSDGQFSFWLARTDPTQDATVHVDHVNYVPHERIVASDASTQLGNIPLTLVAQSASASGQGAPGQAANTSSHPPSSGAGGSIGAIGGHSKPGTSMHDAPGPDLHQEEHIESSEPGGHYDQEIAGDDGLGVIADKRPPVLRRSPPVASSLRFGRPIGALCTWRNIDTQLHRQLRRHARLAPSRILLCHLHDEFADAFKKSWPASLRLPFPKQHETLAMPANQRLGFDDDQGLFPIA
jgi:hypothetical protein